MAIKVKSSLNLFLPDDFSTSLAILDNCLETSSLKFFSIILIDPYIPISLPFESKLSDRPSVNA